MVAFLHVYFMILIIALVFSNKKSFPYVLLFYSLSLGVLSDLYPNDKFVRYYIFFSFFYFLVGIHLLIKNKNETHP